MSDTAAIPRSNAAVLGDLVACADRVLAKPHLAFTEAKRLAPLVPELAASLRRREVDASAMMLMSALAHLGATGPVDRDRWCDIALTLLPWVAQDLRRAAAADLKTPTTEPTR